MDSQPHEGRLSEPSLFGRHRPTAVTLAVCCFLFLAVAVVFARPIGNGFVNFDDHTYVLKNPHLAKGLTAKGCLGLHGRPRPQLASADLALAHAGLPALWLAAGGHHLTNVLLHAASPCCCSWSCAA